MALSSDIEGDEAGIVGERAEGGTETQVEIGHVKGEDAAGREELAQVESEGLARDQVHGDHVAAEGVESDEVVTAVGRIAELTGVAKDVRAWGAHWLRKVK